jgi:hypothetical protein
MAVDSSQLNSASRDAYWEATQAQLKSAQTRGDRLSLLGLGLLCLALWQDHEPGDNVVSWAAGVAGIGLLIVALPQLLVLRSKRHISAVRGMTCQHCGHVPHDTEITESASTRHCQHCNQDLG